MIYATHTGPTTTLIGAADTLVEFEAFYNAIANDDGATGFTEHRQPSVFDMMVDPAFKGFRKPPYVFEHADTAERDAFAQAHGLTVVKQNALRDRHDDMLAEAKREADAKDERTIGEMYGIEEDDPWDQRTEEQKALEAKLKERMEKLRKEGKITSDSFGPNDPKPKDADESKPKSDVHLTDVRIGADGSIDVALGVKGSMTDSKGWEDAPEGGEAKEETPEPLDPEETYFRFSFASSDPDLRTIFGNLGLLSRSEDDGLPPYAKVVLERKPGHALVVNDFYAAKLCGSLERRGVAFTAEEVLGDGTVLAAFTGNEALLREVNRAGMIAIYQRVETTGHSLDALLPILAAAEMDADRQTDARGEDANGAWIDYRTRLLAEKAQAALVSALPPGTEVEAYAVADDGGRILPKGTNVTLANAAGEEEGPRPWNDKADEFAALDEKAQRKAIKAKDFLYCGHYGGAEQGCIVWIAPRTYFQKHGGLWDKSLPVEHLLPFDLKEIEPGVYRTRSSTWEVLTSVLSSRGMRESMLLQIAINEMS